MRKKHRLDAHPRRQREPADEHLGPAHEQVHPHAALDVALMHPHRGVARQPVHPAGVAVVGIEVREQDVVNMIEREPQSREQTIGPSRRKPGVDQRDATGAALAVNKCRAVARR